MVQLQKCLIIQVMNILNMYLQDGIDHQNVYLQKVFIIVKYSI